MVIYSGGIFVELKIKPNKILMWLSYNCLFFSIMLKMLYQTNQNSTIRLLGFGMQAIVLLCYFFGGIDNIKKKINKLYYFDFRDSSCISMCNYYIK